MKKNPVKENKKTSKSSADSLTKKEDKRIISFDEIRELLLSNAETGFIHTTYQEESLRFHYLINGDMRAVKESDLLMRAEIQGKLSKDPLRNYKYLFVVNTGLATRYVIEAGIPQETVYSTSDIYIQKVDLAKSIKEVKDLNHEIWTVLVNMVKEYKKENPYSKQINYCLTYIDSHFNEKITLADLAEKLDLHPCYLATLFKKETGKTFGDYIMDIRIKTSKALLTQTDYTYSQIAYSLAFCSQSHFTKTFHKHTGFTPKEYRMKFYNTNISSVEQN